MVTWKQPAAPKNGAAAGRSRQALLWLTPHARLGLRSGQERLNGFIDDPLVLLRSKPL
jgi:hypothetical protein